MDRSRDMWRCITLLWIALAGALGFVARVIVDQNERIRELENRPQTEVIRWKEGADDGVLKSRPR